MHQWTRWPLRITSSLAALLLFNQAVFAGQFLAGTFPALQTHRDNATYAGIAVLAAAVAAALIRWPGRGPLWPMLACLGLFGLIAAQIVLGFARLLALHIPLGVTIILGGLLLAAWSWRYRPAASPAGPAEPAASPAARAEPAASPAGPVEPVASPGGPVESAGLPAGRERSAGERP